MWTDSLTSGIIRGIRQHPDYNLFIEYLDCKKLGKSRFEVEKNLIKQKYDGIPISGVLVTDNDALDFAFQYDDELFRNVPVVFSGVSNPEDYPLDGSNYYGFKETTSKNMILDLVGRILPDAKRILIIADKTTTGIIYRNELEKLVSSYTHLQLYFPETMDLDSICKLSGHEKDYDAIYYFGISQDKYGKIIDHAKLLEKIGSLAKVPLFGNYNLLNGRGLVGGMFLDGEQNGIESAKLLLTLLNSERNDTIKHIHFPFMSYFFDSKMLEKYGISKGLIPPGSVVINQRELINEGYFKPLVGSLVFLVLVVIVLVLVNARRKNEQRKSSSQLVQIKARKDELEEAYNQLGVVISELEDANLQLKNSNKKLNEAKKKAEESDNLKSAFLANVSHEIRTPLNSIVGFSSLLSEADLDAETRGNYISLIESNTESLLVLIDEIIDLSKIEAQQLTLKKQIFSIDALMDELFQIFNQNHNNPEVRLKMNKASVLKELVVLSDRVRVKQIFINLLSNAGKFTDSGLIEFGYREDEIHGIVLYVKDTGIGISKENHQAIFHRFRKLNENTGKVFRGTGLGLAITQKLVELLGGKIWIESKLGHGACFSFTMSNLTLEPVAE